MRFSLIPRELKFFDMFDDATAVLTRASQKFFDLVTAFDKLEERSRDLKREEHNADDIVERVIKALDKSFITPLDREDINALIARIDDVMDNMEETAHRFWVFRIDRPTPAAAALARIVHECCTHIQQAVHLCRDLKHVDQLQHHVLEIGRLENEADKIYRDSDSALFADPPEILLLIKWRELYGWLEETVDACKAVADVISEIVIKGT